MQANHPSAWRMCAIAFLSYNLTLGCMYGAFGVLIDAVETKLHVTRDLSTLGFQLAMLGISVTAPFAGVLAGKGNACNYCGPQRTSSSVCE